jgi:predicted PurR-regulated permease PerM
LWGCGGDSHRVIALTAVSEIVLPLTFAAVLAVILKPLVGTLRRHRFKPTLATGVVVLGLIALMTGVVVATVQGVFQQTDQINHRRHRPRQLGRPVLHDRS